MIAILLAGVVLATWVGCVGFARLRAPLDRMHCVAFVNATAGVTLAATAVVADGVSIRAMKMLLIAGILLVAGAATSHATGRALLLRGSAKP